MANLSEKIIRVTAKGFDIERRLLFPAGTTCKLLKPDGASANYALVQEILDGWILRFSEFRQQFYLEIATVASDFGATVGGVTHVAINSEVYLLEEGDATKPMGAERPTWKFFCKRTGEQFV